MALKDNDYLETDISMRTMEGGNGDYYIEIWWKENGFNYNKCIRITTSGGNTPTDVKIAAAKLHWAMEAAGLNEYPK